MAALILVAAACGAPVPSPPTMPPSATNGPRSLNCEFLLSRAELQGWIGVGVESVLVSYGDGASCQYQTGRGSAYIVMFTGPNAEEMWSNRPQGTPASAGADINIVEGEPVVHLSGRWLTVSGAAFDGVPLERRIELATLLVTRL